MKLRDMHEVNRYANFKLYANQKDKENKLV